ncbi:hypothetical protein [Caldimonas sp. KR1-144]|uniref:hypothetical protein n=1 Tax=Caldimonas sp. KR1-144 TaxID=3400911 RepID=UPI003C02EA1B
MPRPTLASHDVQIRHLTQQLNDEMAHRQRLERKVEQLLQAAPPPPRSRVATPRSQLVVRYFQAHPDAKSVTQAELDRFAAAN